MALFESYERRIDKINGVLAQYGIGSVEECRRVRYACGPRMLFGAAVRTSLRLLFCCILHPLGLPLFAAWLIGSVLTVPLEYAYVRLTGPWWSSYALRRS